MRRRRRQQMKKLGRCRASVSREPDLSTKGRTVARAATPEPWVRGYLPGTVKTITFLTAPHSMRHDPQRPACDGTRTVPVPHRHTPAREHAPKTIRRTDFASPLTCRLRPEIPDFGQTFETFRRHAKRIVDFTSSEEVSRHSIPRVCRRPTDFPSRNTRGLRS